MRIPGLQRVMGRSEIGRAQNFLAFRNDTEQWNREDLGNILDLHHVPASGA